jgi:NADH:ubiquinone oxidoreductase subunit E
VCVGSSCHLKGSYQIIQRLQELISNNQLDDQIKLSGSFCLASCGKGVTIKINQQLFHAVLDDVDELFYQRIKSVAEV